MTERVETVDVADLLRHAREELLGGRGPGADAAEVAALTRNRASIAGVGTTHQLEIIAQQAARARGGTAAIADDIQRTRSELARTISLLADRLSAQRIVQRERAWAGEVAVRHPAMVIVVAVVACFLFILGWRTHQPKAPHA